MSSYDVIGNIVIVKFKRGVKAAEKKKWGFNFLKSHKNVKTVLEKSEKFKGRLRIQKTKYIAGERTKEALYKENNCVFRLNVDSCYFSPRLSSERKEIADMINMGEEVLVMFGGVAPLAIVIARGGKAKRVISVELGRECSKYALENVRRNKVGERVEIVQGDVRKVIGKGKKIEGNAQESEILGATKLGTAPSRRKRQGFVGFDKIVMPRPNLKDSFLDIAFLAIKKGGMISYYGFYPEEEEGELKKLIEEEAEKAGRRIKILRIKKAGEIGVRKYRYRADFIVY